MSREHVNRFATRYGYVTVLVAALVPLGVVYAADVKDLLKRIPGEANVLVACDVQKIMQSPLAVKEGWAARRADAYGNRPLVVPPEAGAVVMAGLVDFNNLDTAWEVSLIEMTAPRPMDKIARGEGGHTDRIAEKPAVYSPLGAYFVEISPEVLGVVAPANRQFASRWLRQKQTLEGSFVSTYLRTAAGAVDKGTEFVLAIDLEDVVSAPRVARRLEAEAWSALEGKKYNPRALCELLASAKGLTLNVEITDAIQGIARIEFGQDTAPLAELAKPLVLEILSRSGFGLEGLDKWEAKASGKYLTFQGPMSPEAFMRVASIVQPPSPQAPPEVAAAPQTPPAAAGKTEPAAPAADPVREATQGYYKALDRIVQKLTQQIGTGSKSASLSESGAWMRRDARRIQQLPILNVDPDLIDFGNEVAIRLNELAAIYTSGGHRTREATEGVQSAYLGTDDSERLDVDRQRREAAAREKAMASESAAKVLQDLPARRAQIRQMLTQRYQVEF